jgi:redox-sensing transcriptional repressor
MNAVKSLKTITHSAEYIHYLKAALAQQQDNVTAADLSRAAHLELSEVKTDLKHITGGEETTFKASVLLASIQHYLGYDDSFHAILVGVGNIGGAILSYRGFSDYGIDIVAAFDRDKSVVGTEIAGKIVLDIDQMYEICGRTRVLVGILTVPAHEAQEVCDLMVASGIQAIWNFAPTELKVPEHIIVQNENIADSLLTLSGRVEQELKANPERLSQTSSEFDTINAIMAKYGRSHDKLEEALEEAKHINASAAGLKYIHEVMG